ncbi:lytic murein transglycosylase [Thiomicrorhabdus sp. ZW0627]|uniref:lytic murein transglycosylase n=1 Tax=Thiomicrorhabdus sp. ZW0627 TaxID=3039774 RepID=UPI0024365E43|nr:lytic murein transglycosylase [Thiomicrorhabdus sp. ZW0627]MDG6774741.1 lytic murein transglycosylase [Thiomicrorhabdus sp. ZW0627]
MRFRFILLALFLSLALPASASESNEAEFQSWVKDFKKQAVEQGISKTTLDQAFEHVTLNQKVLDLDSRQPEFTRTFWQYFRSAVTEWRIAKGRYLYQKHRRLLDEVTKKYGVPGRFLVAFWGMETNFGGYTGNIPIIESLATLAFDPRRSEFFSKELIDALKILDQGHVTLDEMKGSWAGAMGQCQFMPSNYVRYAVDGDGDGKKDLWGSLPDVFFSAGNFLSTLGWQKQENWGREVSLPENFNYVLADGKTARPLAEWSKMGLKLADGRPLPKEDMQAKLILPSDYRGPAFLVFDNFKVIKRWNNSNNYALGVAHLADRIIGRPDLSKKAPKDDKALSKTQMKSIQERLNWLGYDAGKPDGIVGSQTRSALRAFQAERDLPADGYPSHRMLDMLLSTQK